jgi:hypothetical protein
MTSQEKELLVRFLQQLAAAQPGAKDNEAEALIRDAVAWQPDAAYLLVQRAMQLEHAFEVTQAQAQKLQAELDATRSGTPPGGFLNDSYAWGRSQASVPVRQGPLGQGPAAATPAPTSVNSAAPSPVAAAPRSSWGSGMLGNVATTAAGVVAGSFLFQGIQGLMHHGDTSAPWGHNQSDQSRLTENQVGNNDYNARADDPSPPIDTVADTADTSDTFGADAPDSSDTFTADSNDSSDSA